MVNRPDTISAAATALFVARQTKPREIPVAAKWREREPNEYSDFGAEYRLSSRRPLNSGRQRKKGNIVGFSARAGFTVDLVPSSAMEDFEAFCFAMAERKSELGFTAVLADGYTVPAGGLAFVAGTLAFAKDAATVGNNGLKLVVAGSAANKVNVAGLTAAPGQTGTLRRVGYQFGAGACGIEAGGAGTLPALVSGDIDLTTLGLVPGEPFYLGDDDASHVFASEANRGWCRVLSVAAGRIVLDKTDAAFVTDAGAGKTIRVYFGDRVRDRSSAANQTAFNYAMRRQTGVANLDTGEMQSEVVIGCVANELTMTVPEEDNITMEVSFIGRDYKTFENDALVDAGGTLSRVAEEDAINSTNNTTRTRMNVYGKGAELTAAPVPLFAAFNEFSLSINNNLTENKAVTYQGAYALTPGDFEVSGDFTAYFSGVQSLEAVRQSKDVTFLQTHYKDNKGIAIDLPLIGLATDGLGMELNEPIMIEIEAQAATGRRYNVNFDHTIMAVFFEYLPTVAAQ